MTTDPPSFGHSHSHTPSAAAIAAAPPETAALMRRATYAAVAVAAILVTVKLAAWLITGSVAMLSTLVDSFLDALASVVTLLAVRHALTPADQEHRFGHGKAEPLAGLGQAAFVAGSSTLLMLEVVRSFWRPTPIENTGFGVAVMLLSLVLTIALVLYQRHVVRRTGSLAIKGDSVHYAGDVLTNIGVIASLLATTWFALPWIDSLFALGIAIFLYFNAWTIAREALNMLMDRELPDDERRRIVAIATAHPEVDDVHELRTRAAGPQRFIQLHLEMDGAMPLNRAHEVSDAVEAELRAAFPEAEVLIHQDPAGLDEPHRHK